MKSSIVRDITPCSPLKFNRRVGAKQLASRSLVPCLSYFSTLKIEATCSTETSIDFQRTTRHCTTEDRTFFCVMAVIQSQQYPICTVSINYLWIPNILQESSGYSVFHKPVLCHKPYDTQFLLLSHRCHQFVVPHKCHSPRVPPKSLFYRAAANQNVTALQPVCDQFIMARAGVRHPNSLIIQIPPNCHQLNICGYLLLVQ
jgi:hypothetical protein